MFQSNELEALAEVYPEEERTDLQRFVIENEAVFDAFRMLLRSVSTGEGFRPPEGVSLVGGEGQHNILLRLADENELEVRRSVSVSGETVLVIAHPQSNLSFTAVESLHPSKQISPRAHGL